MDFSLLKGKELPRFLDEIRGAYFWTSLSMLILSAVNLVFAGQELHRIKISDSSAGLSLNRWALGFTVGVFVINFKLIRHIDEHRSRALRDHEQANICLSWGDWNQMVKDNNENRILADRVRAKEKADMARQIRASTRNFQRT